MDFWSGLLTGGIGLWLIQRIDGGWKGLLERKGKEKDALALLRGLPPDAKGALANYKVHGTHTLWLSPRDPMLHYLLELKILIHGSLRSLSPIEPVAFMVVPWIWKLMDRWIASDPEIAKIIEDLREPGSESGEK